MIKKIEIDIISDIVLYKVQRNYEINVDPLYSWDKHSLLMKKVMVSS